MDRQEALALVNEWTQAPHLLRHMLAVETAMRAYAQRFGEDEELWGLTGLLHDFDYERYPDLTVEGHPVVGSRVLRERGVPEVAIQAVLAHAEYTGVPADTKLAKTLRAVDELTGFLTAVALVRPSKSIKDVELKSIHKKWKDKLFAAPVNRQEIEHAAGELGVSLDDHLQFVLSAMKANAEELGL